METSTRIIDYHLKERIEGQNSKITLSGRKRRKEGCGLHLLFLSSRVTLELMITERNDACWFNI